MSTATETSKRVSLSGTARAAVLPNLDPAGAVEIDQPQWVKMLAVRG